jgi:hypothetical protein
MRDPDRDDEHRCERCGSLITTCLMAAFCPHRERCEFWPAEHESQAFLDALGMRVKPQPPEVPA